MTHANPTPWAVLYADPIQKAAAGWGLEPLLLLALVWQESHGGVVLSGGRWSYSPGRLYRYEPAFWDRYLAGKPEYASPSSHPAAVEAWKRRLSASWGICQVMTTTAFQHGFRGEPEALLNPYVSAEYGAQHLRHLLDHPTAGGTKNEIADALAGYNTGRSRDEWTTYDNEVLDRLGRLRSYADTGRDPFAGE